MKRDPERVSFKRVSLPQPTPSDLRGRQSVRATFRVSEKAIDAISIIAAHLGIKQKSLFDHLIEDVDALNRIADELHSLEFNVPRRIQKTFVLSRKTLSNLDRVSKASKTSRDALVEFSLQRLLPLIEQEREKHARRKELLGIFTDYCLDGKNILKLARDALGDEDPVYEKLEYTVDLLLNAHSHIKSFVEKGSVIEKFD